MIRALVLFAGFAVALPAFAATGITFQQWVDGTIVPFIDKGVIPLLYILAFVFFLIGVVRYFFTGGEENRKTGRAYIMWALIGMVIIWGVWGIVRILLTVIPGA